MAKFKTVSIIMLPFKQTLQKVKVVALTEQLFLAKEKKLALKFYYQTLQMNISMKLIA